MAIGLGGNPYGPAGTGKTESVKALGGLFGRQVLVFNCDEVSLAICISLNFISTTAFAENVFISSILNLVY
jgi:MoxR-like ATPase